MTETWRHRDGSVRVDHMDASPGDYYGKPKVGDTAQTRATPAELEDLLRTGIGGKRKDRPKQQRKARS